MNNATICNSWFKKRPSLKTTWQHPRSKQWHCIDYIITSQSDRRHCLDAQVIRSAECGSDHQLLCVRFFLGWYQHRVNPSAVHLKRGRFDISKLVRPKNDETNRDTPLRLYQNSVSEHISDKWKPSDSVEKKWCVLRDSIVGAASDVLGHRQRKQHDWYAESLSILEPLIAERNNLYSLWLQHGRSSDLQNFKNARSNTRAGVRKAKSDWISTHAELANVNRFSGRTVWHCVRALQSVEHGPVRMTTSTINDENGYVCSSVESQTNRWRQHFSRVLNVRSTFTPDIVASIPQMDCDHSLSLPPTRLELLQAISQCKNGKAAGESGILPELVKVCPDVFVDHLVELLVAVWDSEVVPVDWVNAQMVPIPKKGNLAECDNWRGIALLDVLGKVVARIIQSRLSSSMDSVLPDSQCGFRKNRGCMDMVFAARQIVEKSFEHKQKCFFVFIDLKKAYDSVPRECLWLVLAKAGIPDKLIAIIRGFHEGMTASLRLAGGSSDTQPISVENGLRQGCCMAPVLFNIFMWAVIECWRQRVKSIDGVGIDVFFEPDGKLLHRRNRRNQSLHVTECQFADDSALVATSRPAAVLSLDVLVQVCSSFGLTVSATKTKFMVTGDNITSADIAPLAVSSMLIDHVPTFRYLGCNITNDGRCCADVKARIAQAAKVFGTLKRPIFLNRALNLSIKRSVFNACVLSTLLYGAECWIILQADLYALTSFFHRCVRSILGVRKKDVWQDRISNAVLLDRWGDSQSMEHRIRRRRLEWLGHMARMEDDRIPKALLFGSFPGKRPAHGPRKRWRDCARLDVHQLPEWYQVATSSRRDWRQFYLGLHDKDNSDTDRSSVSCRTCRREFRRLGDLKRHKCAAIRRLPAHLQPGSCCCPRCNRWFLSKGGLASHKCTTSSGQQRSAPTPSPTPASSAVSLCLKCRFHCHVCNRCVLSAPGVKRHRCSRGTRANTAQRASFDNVCDCGRQFKRPQDLQRHRPYCSEPAQSHVGSA